MWIVNTNQGSILCLDTLSVHYFPGHSTVLLPFKELSRVAGGLFLSFSSLWGHIWKALLSVFLLFHPDLKGEILYDGTHTSARKTSHLFFIYFSPLGKGNAEQQ